MTTVVLSFAGVPDTDPYPIQPGFTSRGVDTAAVASETWFNNLGTGNTLWECNTDPGTDTYSVYVQLSLPDSNARGVAIFNSLGNGFMFIARDFDLRVFALTSYVLAGSVLDTYSTTFVDDGILRIDLTQSTGTYVVKNDGATIGTFVDTTYTSGLVCGLLSRNFGAIKNFTLEYAGASTSIDTVTTDGNPGLVIGQPFAMTTTGLGTITGITITTAATPTATTDAINLALPGGDGAGEMKDWVDAEFYAYPGTVIVEATDGVDTASGSYTLSMPDDTVNVIFADVETTDNTYIGTKLNDIGHPLEDGDIGYYPTGNGLAIGTNSHVSCLGAMVFVLWIQKLDGVMEMYSVTINDAGEITDVTGITSRGITSRGITSRNITSRGLS
jgi:hypothetical protein